MNAADLDVLRTVIPEQRVLTSPADLRSRSRDWWALARLREARGDALQLPAAAVLPATTDEVSRILAWADRLRVPIVPRGLGSGVCGGVMPPAGAVVLDLSAMNEVLSLDRDSQMVTVHAGIRGSDLEAFLNREGLTIGHYPQSMDISTVGGWIASSSAGQASPGYGSIENHLLGLTAVLADGTVVRLAPQPRATVGPNLRMLLVGSEGTLAVVTEAHLACAPLDPSMAWQAFKFASFDDCLAAARDIGRAGVGARVLRGWDLPDSVRAFGLSHGHVDGSIGVIGLPVSAPGLEARQAKAAALAQSRGASVLDGTYGEHWYAHRLDAVNLFERIMGPERMLGAGGLIDTLEVTGLWRDLPTIHARITAALATGASEVRCHFSHVYPSGAALYFTFLIQERDEDAAEAAYLAVWHEALAACQASHAAIAHHHGLGRLKAPALAADIGSGATQLLRRVKAALDPNGILNPGALIPAPETTAEA